MDKLVKDYLLKRSEIVSKNWLETGNHKRRKYFGFLSRKALASIIVAILILTITANAGIYFLVNLISVQ